MGAESAFFALVYLPLRSTMQGQASHPENLCKEDRQALIRRCADRIPKPELYISKWFLESPLSEIKRENVKEFYAWSLLDKEYEDADEAEIAELDLYTDQLEEKLGRRLEDGWGNAQSLRLTLQSVPIQHRPLIWYAVSIYNNARHHTDGVTNPYADLISSRVLFYQPPLVQLFPFPPDFSEIISLDVSVSVPFTLQPKQKSLSDSRLLASQSHVEKQSAYSLHPWDWNWSLRLCSILDRPQCE